MPNLPHISPELLQKYQDEISRRSSPATHKRKVSSLKRFFDWAKQEGHTDQNPFENINLQENNPDQSIISVQESQNQRQKQNFITTSNLLKVGILGVLALLLFIFIPKLKFPASFLKIPAFQGENNSTSSAISSQPSNQQPILLSPWTIFTKMNLKDTNGQSVGQSQTISFSLYKNENDTNAIWVSDPKQVTPDINGNILISLDNVPTDLFFKNNRLFLSTDIAGQTSESKIPISTANSAANLQGYFPSKEGEANTIPIISSDGALNLASQSPAIKAKNGNFLIEGQAVTITTPTASDGDITINPDGNGTSKFIFEGNSGNMLDTQASNLTSGSLFYGKVANNATGYNLIKLESGTNPTTKFSVDAAGNTQIAANLNVSKDIQTSSTTRLSSSGALSNITGYNQSSGNFSISQTAGETANIIKKGTALSDLMTLTLDERNKPVDRNSIYSTLKLRRYDGAVEAMALLVDEGNAQFNGQLRLGRYTANPATAIGTGSIIYNTTDQKVYYWNGTAWTSLSAGAATNYWQRNSGVLSPDTITDNFSVGATDATAPFYVSNSGTVTFSSDTNLYRSAANSLKTDDSLIVGSALTVGGATTLSSLGTGIIHSDATGLLSSSAINLASGEVTGILPLANGGTNKNLTPAAGGVVWTDADSMEVSTAGNSGQVLQSNGTSAPSWIDTSSLGTNFWNQASGALSPKNSSVDFLIGGAATASAKFAFINVATGTPTASIAGNIVLDSTGTISTTKKQNLTIGDTNTGKIIFNGGNVGVGSTDPQTLLQVGTGATTALVTKPNIFVADASTSYLSVKSGTNPEVFLGSDFNTYGIIGTYSNNSLGFRTNNNLKMLLDTGGNLGIGTETPTAKLDVEGDASTSASLVFRGAAPTVDLLNNSALTFQSSVGGDTGLTSIATLSATGNFSVQGSLTATNGLTVSNGTVTLPNTSILNAYISEMDWTKLQNYPVACPSGQAISAVGDTLTCIAVGSAGSSWWNQQDGALLPANSTVDLLIGGTATTSAKFAFINVDSGTPTASIAGDITLAAATGTTRNITGTNANPINVNGVVIGNNGNITSGVWNGTDIDISDYTNLSATNGIVLTGDQLTHSTANGYVHIPQDGASTQLLQYSSAGTAKWVSTSGDVTMADGGALTIQANAVQGTDISLASEAAGDIMYFDGTDWVRLGKGTSAQTLHSGDSPSWGAVSLTADVSGVLPLANGGTNKNMTAVAGGVIWSDADSLEVSAAGNTGQILQSNGTSAPSWVDATGLGVNLWSQALGALSPKNSTVDLLIGGTATTSAKFAFINVDSGTPTASIAGDITLAAATGTTRNITGTNANPINVNGVVIGNNGNITSGVWNGTDIDISDYTNLSATNGIVLTGDQLTHSTANGYVHIPQDGASTQLLQYSSAGTAKWVSTSGDVTMADGGALTIQANAVQGTDISLASEAAGDIMYFDGTDWVRLGKGTSAQTLHSGDSPSWGAVSLTADVSGVLPLANGGTNKNMTAVAGGVIWSDADSLEVSAAGNTGQILQSNGTSAPSWVDATGLGVNLWSQALGALSPKNSTVDLLIGGTATTSAKFAFINVDSGTPTASIAGDITLAAATGTTRNITGTNANPINVNGVVIGNNGNITSGVWNGTDIDISDYTNLSATNGIVLTGDQLTHSTANGYVHIPQDGASTQLLQYSSAGTAKWVSTSGDVTMADGGALTIQANAVQGTDISLASEAAGDIMYFDGTDWVRLGKGTSAQTLHSGDSPSWGAVSLTADVSGVLPLANGGTNKNMTAVAGGVIWSDADSLEVSAAGNTGQILQSNGTSAPSWVDATGLGVNLWSQALGALSPKNSTVDLLIGGTATTSAKFAFINVDSGTPTASIAGDITLAAATGTTRNITGTNANPINVNGVVIGNNGNITSGVWNGTDIDISDYTNLSATNGIVLTGDQLTHSTANGYVHIPQDGASTQLLQYSSAGTAKWVSTSGDVTMADGGALTIQANAVQGTDISLASEAAGDIMYFDGTDWVRLGKGTSAQTLHSGDSPSWGAVSLTADVSGVLPLANGGTNKNMTAVAGGVIWSDADSLEVSAAGNTGQILQSNGTSAPSWVDATGLGVNLWSQALGALSPKNSTVDLLIGGTATTSAKFAFINVDSGTPTASIAGDITLAAATGTTRNITGTNANPINVNGVVIGNNGNITSGVWNGTDIDISDYTNLSATNGIVLTGDQLTHSTANGYVHIPQDGASTQLLQYSSAGTAKWVSTSGDVTMADGGALTIQANAVQGTDISLASEAAGDIMYFDGTDWVRLGKGTSAQTLHSGDSPSWGAVSLTADVSGVLPLANGGTNKNMTAVAGGVIWSDADSLEVSAAGNTGQILQSNGTSAPSWVDATGLGVNLWSQALGALSPKNSTVDLLIGGTATTSAKFAFINVDSGTPTASIAGDITLAAATGTTRNITGTNANPINVNGVVIGNNGNITSGVWNGTDIDISDYTNLSATNGIVLTGDQLTHSTANGYVHIPQDGASTQLLQYSSAGTAKWVSTSGDVTMADGGALTIQANAVQGTDISLASEAAGDIMYFDGTDWVRLGKGTSAQTLHSGDSPSWGAVSLTADVSGVLPLANGGTNKNMTAVAGGVIWSDADSLEVSAAGNTGQILQSNGTSAPSWVDATGLGVNLWSQALGALSPKNSTVDLLIGGTATTSAKFAFINVDSGTPTASIAGDITLAAATGTTRNITGTNANPINVNGVVIGNNGNITSGVWNGTDIDISDYTNLSATNGIVLTGDQLTHSTANGYVHIPQDGASTQLLQYSSAGTAKWVSTSGDVTMADGGALTIQANAVQGTDISLASEAAGDIMYFDGTDWVRLGKGTSAQTLHSGDSPSWGAVSLTADVSGVLPLANGGTNKNMTAVAGGVIWSDADSLEVSAAGNTGQILQSNGTSAPSWVDATGLGVNLWSQALGALSPKNSTVDLLIGGTATTSAKFAFINVDSGTPTASIAGDITLAAATGTTRNITGTNANPINVNGVVIGNNGNITSGVWNGTDIDISDYTNLSATNGIVLTGDQLTHSTANGYVHIPQDGASTQLLQYSSAGTAKWVSTSGDVTMADGGALTIQANAVQGTDISLASEAAGDIMYFDGTDWVRLGKGTSAQTLHSGDSPSWGAVSLTADVSGVLPLANGGTNKNMTAVAGGVIWSDADSLEVSAAGNTGQILQSNGTSAPSWVDATGLGVNLWSQALGALSPKNSTVDLLIGGTATTSAKFAFINVDSGTPTASIAGDITLAAATGTTRNITGTNANPINVNGVVIGNNGNITSGVWNGTDIDISDYTNLSATNGIVLTGDQLTHSTANGYVHIPQDGASTQLLQYSSAGTAKWVSTSGDVTMADGGALTIQANAVQGTDISLASEAAGDIMYFDGTDWVRLAKGNAGQLLETGTTPSWVNPPSGSTNWWNQASGALSPLNSTVDLLIGGTASNSAKFGFINVAGGTPTFNLANQASNIAIKDNTASALKIVEGANTYLDITTSDDAESFNLDLPAGGVTSLTANLFTSNIAKTINLGTGTAIDTINIGTGGTGADIIGIGSANAGNVTVQSNAVLTLHGEANSIIDFVNFDVATTGNITTAGDLAVNGDDITSDHALTITPAAGTNLNVALSDTGDLAVNTNHLYVDTSEAKVGIGTATPGDKLDVAGNIRLSGATSNTVFFGTTGVAAPGAGSAGEKLQLYGTAGTVGVNDYSMGVEGSFLWSNSDSGFKWYSDSVLKMTLDNNGNMTLTGDLAVNGGDITSTQTALNMAVANTGTISFTDGTNNLVQISDQGTTGRLAVSDALQVAGLTTAAYSRFGAGTATHTGAITTSTDLLLSADLEIDGVLYLDGGQIANSAGTAAIILTQTPQTAYNTLSTSSWLIDNTANVGMAALMVNQGTTGQDLFTASAASAPKFTIHNDGSITLAGMASTTVTNEASVYYDTDVDHLYLRTGDSAWHRLAMDMTKYASNSPTVANTSYVEVAHNQGTNDLSLTGWVYDNIISQWKKIDNSNNREIIHSTQTQFDSALASGKIRTQTTTSGVNLLSSVDTGSGADGEITISADTVINTTNKIVGRSCADGGDAVNYSVSSFTNSTTAVLTTTPSTGCLAAGDEVLIINLMGGNAAFSNVGNYETLKIQSIATDTITLASAKTKYYGANAGDDTNIGTAAGKQKVMLQRVPNYTNITVDSGKNFTPIAFNGSKGGVMFFRATGVVTVNGNIHANALGDPGGAKVDANSVHTGGNGGDAYCGTGGASTGGSGASGAGGAANSAGGNGSCGGGGGGTYASGAGGTGSASAGGSGGGGGGSASGGGGGGYGTAGLKGIGPAANGVDGGTNASGNGGSADAVNGGGGGGGGGTFGSTDLAKIYLGTGGGGGGDYNALGSAATGAGSGAGGNGGGIVMISANTLTVSGTVASNGANGIAIDGGGYCTVSYYGGGGGGGSGGSIKIQGSVLTLGTNLVSATKGTGGNGCNNGSAGGAGGNGGNGRTGVFYTTSYSGSANSPAPTYTQQYNYPYGLYHSPVIATPNAINYESVRWESNLATTGKISFQTRSGNSTDPTDGSWEAWKPSTATTNYLTLNDANTHTDWTGTNLTVADGAVTRSVAFFEDEAEATAGNTTKLSAVGSANGYAERDLGAGGVLDISSYDYLTAWVYATGSGNMVKLGFGEAASTEQEETVTTDAANTWQKVYWDISDVAAASRNAVRYLRVSVLSTNMTVHFDNIKAESLMTTASGSTITSTPNNYVQYRAVITTTNTSNNPRLINVTLGYNNGYKIVQTDTNTVRLYNYTGASQNLRLDAVVFGADLAEYYTVEDESIGPGDVVALTGRLDEYKVPILRKAISINDPQMVGVISTKAGQTLGLEADNRRLLALTGRIPVKIASDSAAIATGDYLTSSFESGRARKAKLGEKTLGKALEEWQPGSGKEQILILVGNSSSQNSPTLADLGQYLINKIEGIGAAVYQIISTTGGEILDNVVIASKAVFANVEAGAIITKEITADSFTAFQGTVDNLLVSQGLVSPIVKTETISPLANSDLVIDLANGQTASDSSYGKMVIKGQEGKEVAGFDAQGNATFSGELYANKIYTDQIVAKNWAGMTREEVETLLKESQNEQSILTNTISNSDLSTATNSASLKELALETLYVTNTAAMTSLSLSSSLTVGSDLVIQSQLTNDNQRLTSIDTLSAPLKLQSLALAPIEIMAGKIRIDTSGNVQINGNLYVAGNIDSQGLTLKPKNESSFGKLLSVQDVSGLEKAAVDASGAATFASITTDQLVIANSQVATDSAIVNGEIETNATAGSATIPGQTLEIKIKNPKITDYTLVYVTPTSSTQNNVLYVKNKGIGFFTVGFNNPIDKDTTFNWWVIEIKQ